MTLQQLRYVTVVAGTGTISHAVQQFYISQPSLTNAIRELEQEVGLALSKTASSVVSRTRPPCGRRMYPLLQCGWVWYTEIDNSEFMKSEALILLCGMN